MNFAKVLRTSLVAASVLPKLFLGVMMHSRGKMLTLVFNLFLTSELVLTAAENSKPVVKTIRRNRKWTLASNGLICSEDVSSAFIVDLDQPVFICSKSTIET